MFIILYYNSWYYSICINDVFRHRLELLKCLPLKMLLVRFHYQDKIYLPRPQSLAIVLVVFKLNYQVKRDKGGNRKGRKKANVLPSHLSLRTLKKPAHEAMQIIRGMRCYSSYFHPTLFEEVIVYDFYWFLALYNNILKWEGDYAANIM